MSPFPKLYIKYSKYELFIVYHCELLTFRYTQNPFDSIYIYITRQTHTQQKQRKFFTYFRLNAPFFATGKLSLTVLSMFIFRGFS